MRTISAKITEEQFKWLSDRVREGRFASISHGIRVAIKRMMEAESR